MVLVDKKILSGGLAMVVVGITISLYLNSVTPIGTTGMSNEETLDLLTKQQENQDVSTLAGILMAIGFLLVLVLM